MMMRTCRRNITGFVIVFAFRKNDALSQRALGIEKVQVVVRH